MKVGRNPIILIIILFILFFSVKVYSQTAKELQSKIDQRNQDIQALEKEIASYQTQIEDLSSQASSLSATIKSLDLTQKKLEANIKVTENKIIDKNIQIKQLGVEIIDKEETIIEDRRIISQSFATMNELGTKSLPELLLAEKSLSESWNAIDEISTVQKNLFDRIAGLKTVKANLETNKKATEKAKNELLVLGRQLNDQKKIVIETTKENNLLLKETKNNQSSYTQLLKDRQLQKDTFEREVLALESALKVVIDPNSIPKAGTAILNFPLDVIRVTQYFGNTAFAAKNPQVYKGSSGEHNGVDFAATRGTVVRASASGTVTNVINANSNIKCGYGNWISISHPNGLTTLYAHLSLNVMAVGSTVSTGQVIGYSGNSGYTTGPHLHFGLYVTKGFQTANSSSCPGLTIPVASFNAYLNPLSYLP